MKLRVKLYNSDMPKFKKIDKGDWIDVRVNTVGICNNTKEAIECMQKYKVTALPNRETNTVKYKAGEVVLLRLGFALELPDDYEAELKPRSGTFKNTGLILTNSVGCIDNTYCGNADEWMMMCYATRDGEIELFDRVGQFRIVEKMPPLDFEYVDDLGNDNRGGFNSTGTK